MDTLTAGLFTLSLHQPNELLASSYVPLQSVSVEASVVHIAAHVTIEQVFLNEHSSPIEAVYRFPLNEQAAICGFEAEIGKDE